MKKPAEIAQGRLGKVIRFPVKGMCMTKDECERAIRSLVHDWADQVHPGAQKWRLSDTEFMGWLRKNHPETLQFRSRIPNTDVVEQWFSQETKQTWRN